MTKTGWRPLLIAAVLAGVLGACAQREQTASYTQPDYHSWPYTNQPGGG